MKLKPWFSTLIAFALFLACALGCSKSSPDGSKKESAERDSNAATQATTPPADIAGDYAIVGTNEDGSPYKGALEVIKHGDVYQFRWDAGKQYDGVGVPNGNVVAVAFTNGSNGKDCGVVSYQILQDGKLDGKWDIGAWMMAAPRGPCAPAGQAWPAITTSRERIPTGVTTKARSR